MSDEFSIQEALFPADPSMPRADETFIPPLPPGTSMQVTVDDVKRYFDAKWKIKGCEICEADDWGFGGLASYGYLASGDGTMPSTHAPLVSTFLYVYCQNCGNTKMLNTGFIATWLRNNPRGD